jgi:para-nitrobenzyl esterase
MQERVFADMNFRSPGISEDCLTLNVWAPPHCTPKCPVLLYFYGGGFVAGDGSEYRYDGESLARRGVIVVTANYRLGVFGFLALESLARESRHQVSGNYGLIDQISALDWVLHNIAAFGGSPGGITIGGESAGSISVTALMVSPLSRDMIAGAIGESGGLINPTLPPVLLDTAMERGREFATALGGLSLSALRDLPADTLLARAAGRQFPIAIDGWVLTTPPETTLAHGWQASVPLLVGWNSEEGSWRRYFDSVPPTPQNWVAVLKRIFGDQADSALHYFPGTDSNQVKQSATLMSGANYTALSTWKWAQMAARTGGHPVYVYQFTRPRPGATRAVHSAEIEYALGNLGTNHVYAWTPDDSITSAVTEAYVEAFVKNGTPEATGLPAWPALAGDSPRVMVLNEHPHPEDASFAAAFRFLDTFLRSRTH